jgi:hypothetical protein
VDQPDNVTKPTALRSLSSDDDWSNPAFGRDFSGGGFCDRSKESDRRRWLNKPRPLACQFLVAVSANDL